MITYHYPPQGESSGVLRARKFSKYLPSNGWIPHVVTLQESFYQTKDDGLKIDIPPEARVHRTFAVDTSRPLAISGKHITFFTIPDRLIGWFPFGVLKGLRVIRKENIDVLYSTSPPPTAHLIAGSLKVLTGIPWIADFRDPWIEDGYFPRPGSFRFRIESTLERWVVQHCERLLVTTPNLRDDFLSRYGNLSPDKVQVIYNGYDEDDFQAVTPVSDSEQFEIIHAGLVTPEFRDPFPLLKVMRSLIKENAFPPGKVKITFLGGGPWVTSADFVENVRRIGLERVVQIDPQVSHREALCRMAKAAVLLVMQASDDTRSLIPAKT